jgi:4-amino-4-deoxy-L-arabinose transferase-like glycosyltransferase
LPSESGSIFGAHKAHRRNVHALVVVLLVGALVRAGLWYTWTASIPFSGDERDYRNLAVRLTLTGEYTDEHGNRTAMRPPLYPAVVAGVYECFGLKNDDAVRALQAGISLLTVVLVYRLGEIAYSPQVALWAAAICCLYPSFLAYANVLLTETLFTFLLTAFIWLFLEAVGRQSRAVLIAAGITLGLAALTRSIMLPFLPLLTICALVYWRGNWSRRFLAAACITLAFAITIAPWAVRNTRLYNSLTFIDVMGGRNFMMGNYEYTPLERSWATISDVEGDKNWFHVLQRERKIPSPVMQNELDRIALRHAIEFIRNHPQLTMKRAVVKFFNFWQLEREFLAAARAGYFSTLFGHWLLLLAVIICGSYAAVLFAALFGCCCVPPTDVRLHSFLIISLLFPCAVHTMIFAHSRYHIPVIPLLTVYAAAAIVYRRQIWLGRRSWRFGVAAAICLIIAVGWLRELLFVDTEAVQNLLG